jgi:hypothetical protein
MTDKLPFEVSQHYMQIQLVLTCLDQKPFLVQGSVLCQWKLGGGQVWQKIRRRWYEHFPFTVLVLV